MLGTAWMPIWAVLALLLSVKLAISQVPAHVIIVTTEQELKAAIDGGAEYVHIISHLDLTTLPPAPLAVGTSVSALFELGTALQSLTVRPYHFFWLTHWYSNVTLCC
jgi:hypothetical protein